MTPSVLAVQNSTCSLHWDKQEMQISPKCKSWISHFLFFFLTAIECPPPEPIEHGFINQALRDIFHYQDIVSYGCYPPYVIDGASESRCEKTGTWSNKPSCKGKAVCIVFVQNILILFLKKS